MEQKNDDEKVKQIAAGGKGAGDDSNPNVDQEDKALMEKSDDAAEVKTTQEIDIVAEGPEKGTGEDGKDDSLKNNDQEEVINDASSAAAEGKKADNEKGDRKKDDPFRILVVKFSFI